MREGEGERERREKQAKLAKTVNNINEKKLIFFGVRTHSCVDGLLSA